MKIEQVAAQLYTIRDQIKTPAEIAAAMKKVRAVGYEAVQVSGMGPIDEKELKAILDGEGLVCCATHEPSDKIINDPMAIVDRLDKLNCKYTAYPYPSNVKLDSLADVVDLADKLNAAGKVLYENGKVLAYHNHSIEFRRFDDDLMLDVIYENTDPRYLKGEIDTYWVQHGGGDPIEWCSALKDRLPLLHMKDYVINSASQPTMTEIGNGNLNWSGIVSAADYAGCEWYIVEQDICEGDPIDSLKISYEYIRDFLCE